MYAPLKCDPNNNMCCTKVYMRDAKTETGLLPTKEKCEAMSHCEHAPDFVPKCILVQDKCAQIFEDSFTEGGIGHCTDECTFHETFDFRSRPVVGTTHCPGLKCLALTVDCGSLSIQCSDCCRLMGDEEFVWIKRGGTLANRAKSSVPRAKDVHLDWSE